ncbi:hypothetical protein V6N12_055296 [Hibiscus sabdariffa]
MPNSDEIDTSVEAGVNNSHGPADVNVLSSASTLEQSGPVALTTGPSALFGQTSTGNSQTGGGRPMSSPLYTQLSTQYVAPLPQHPAMMQSSPTRAAQLHIATPEARLRAEAPRALAQGPTLMGP